MLESRIERLLYELKIAKYTRTGHYGHRYIENAVIFASLEKRRPFQENCFGSAIGDAVMSQLYSRMLGINYNVTCNQTTAYVDELVSTIILSYVGKGKQLVEGNRPSRQYGSGGK